MKQVVKSKTTMTEEDRLFLPAALSASQRACTLFIATRMSVDTSDWSTFEVRIQKSCLIWEGWSHNYILTHTHLGEGSHKELSNGVRHVEVP